MAASETERQRPSSLYMDLKELRVRFSEVDVDEKGYIDYSGLKEMVLNMDGFDSSASEELMTTLDRDGDGKVTFEDFQILFTLERDAVKEQRGLTTTADSSILSTGSSSAGYVTALHSPRNSLFFSPEKPQGRSFRSLNTVPDSPDLSMHVRSLQSRRHSYDQQLSTNRLSISSNGDPIRGSEGGDQVLEDTGTVGNTSSSPAPPNVNSFMGLELIERELQSICGSEDVVHREDISKLCDRLGIDANDEQEFIRLWDDLVAVSDNNEVSVELMYQSIKQRETIAMVTSTPANQPMELIKNKRPKLISMDPLTSEPSPEVGRSVGGVHSREDSQQMSSSIDDEIDGNEDDDEDEEMLMDMDNDSHWTDGRHFPFHEHVSVARPSSAREGSRLSKGMSDSSLRKTSFMQNFYSEYQQLQENLEQVSQERNKLQQQLARAEADKKRLIQEGEESVLNLQRQKEAKIRKLEKDFHTKQKGLEASLSFDYQTQQEYLQDEISKLNHKYRELKSTNEEMKDDLRYYQLEHEELLEKIDALHNTVKKRDEKILILQEKLGLTSDSQSEFDLEIHSTRIQELEAELQIRADHNEGLKQANTELQDQVDELKAECEKIKMKYNEEKRKRQRRASDITDHHHQQQQHKSSHHHRKSRHSRSSRSGPSTGTGRQLPSIPQTPVVPDNYYSTEGVDYEEPPLVIASAGHEEWGGGGSDSDQPYSSVHDDILTAVSSTSLLEEMRVSDEQHNLVLKIEELQGHRISLENTCVELRAKMNRMEENNIALKNKFEQELSEKEAMARQDKENITSLQEYLAEQKKQLQSLREDNKSLQYNLNQQSLHISQIINERKSLENRYKQMEAKMESQDKELKRTEAKACLAIVDLSNKENECSVQQKKVEKLERELHRLHKNCDNYVNRIEHMERELRDGESEKKELMDAQSKLQSELDSVLLHRNESSGDISHSAVGLWSPELGASSPIVDQSFASNISQNEILYQMKGQLEQLQNVLIEKGPEEGSEIELSFVQELLTINTDMEQSLLQQHQQYNQLVSSRDEHIRLLEERLVEVQGMLDESRTANDSVVCELQEEMRTALATKEKEKLEAVLKLENELNEQQNSAEFNRSIIQKQKEEIAKLNHYFGKARFEQVNCDSKNEEMEKHIEEQNQQLMDQSKLIEELQRGGVSKSEPLLHYGDGKEDQIHTTDQLHAELLTGKEALSTAEGLISDMRQQLLDLYQHVMRPSDSQASDLLEFTDLINHLKETYDSINEEIMHSKSVQEMLQEKIMASLRDYESLYSEHDEEVKSLKQQNDVLLLEFIDVKKNVEAKIHEQMKSEKLKLLHQLSQVTKDNESINKALQKALEDKQSLKETLALSRSKIQDLNKSKAHLINLVRTLSIETLTTLSAIHQ